MPKHDITPAPQPENNTASGIDTQNTLVPMLIWGLVLITASMMAVMFLS